MCRRGNLILKMLVLPFIFVGAVMILSGCSVVMAAKQPPKKDLSVLIQGSPRTGVIAELGTPLWSEEQDGKRTDIFSFQQGYSKGAKVGRALFHGVADIFSLGLWEVVGTPTEAVFDGQKLKVEVIYDAEDRVETATIWDQKGSVLNQGSPTPTKSEEVVQEDKSEETGSIPESSK